MPAMSDGSPRSRCWSRALKPIPTLLRIRRNRLFGVSDEERPFFCQLVHARARRKIFSRLRATMHHYDQRAWLTVVAARDEELVSPRAALASITFGQKIRPFLLLARRSSDTGLSTGAVAPLNAACSNLVASVRFPARVKFVAVTISRYGSVFILRFFQSAKKCGQKGRP